MPTATKKRLPIPVLRTTRRRLVCRGPGESSHWQWHFCPQENAFSHLVLLAGPLVLAHWVLPAPWPEAVTAPLPGIWMQVPVATPLAVPARSQAVAHGTCRVPHQVRALASSALPAGQLLLHLPAAASAEGYVLTQLRPGGPGWLLRKLTSSSQSDTQ